MPNEPRCLWVTVCDDVRREINGKLSLIGVYGAKMFLSAFPARLAKLCFVMTARTSSMDPFETLTFKVLKDDSLLLEGGIDKDSLSKAQSQAIVDVAEEGLITIGFVAEIGPLEIEAPCKLRLRAYSEQGEHRGGSISVEPTPGLATAPPPTM